MWFAVYVVLGAAIMGMIWLASRSGGIGEARNLWVVGALLLAGALYAATARVRRTQRGTDTPGQKASGRTSSTGKVADRKAATDSTSPATAPKSAKTKPATSSKSASSKPAPPHHTRKRRH